MNYHYTTNYTKTATISAISLIATVAAILAVLAVVDVMSWSDVYEVLWRTGAVLLIAIVLSAVTGLLADWSKSSK